MSEFLQDLIGGWRTWFAGHPPNSAVAPELAPLAPAEPAAARVPSSSSPLRPVPGFDTAYFPGLPIMSWLKAHTNLQVAPFYMGPAPSHKDASFMTHREELVALGWGLLPVYVGQQVQGPGEHTVTYAQGLLDGAEAGMLMEHAGFPDRSVVFLDVEGVPGPGADTTLMGDYIEGWATALRQTGYAAGVYCSHFLAAWVNKLVPGVELWVVHCPTVEQTSVPSTYEFPAPSMDGCGWPYAAAWQNRENVVMELPITAPKMPFGNPHQLLIDTNVCATRDPSAPLPDAAAVLS